MSENRSTLELELGRAVLHSWAELALGEGATPLEFLAHWIASGRQSSALIASVKECVSEIVDEAPFARALRAAPAANVVTGSIQSNS